MNGDCDCLFLLFSNHAGLLEITYISGQGPWIASYRNEKLRIETGKRYVVRAAQAGGLDTVFVKYYEPGEVM
jgi:hypothetical protein